MDEAIKKSLSPFAGSGFNVAKKKPPAYSSELTKEIADKRLETDKSIASLTEKINSINSPAVRNSNDQNSFNSKNNAKVWLLFFYKYVI